MQDQQYNPQTCDNHGADTNTQMGAKNLFDQVLVQFASIASRESNAHVVSDHMLRDIGLQRTVARHI